MDADDLTINGDEVWFRWEYGIGMPLWDREQMLPEEPEWLRAALGLSDGLIADLAYWGSIVERLGETGRPVPEAVHQDLGERAQRLVERLRDEVAPRYAVRYEPERTPPGLSG